MEEKQIQQINNINALLIAEENDDIDVLDRKAFIERIMQIIEYYSDKKQAVSFSIQGDWGSGKSWIINKVYNELYDIQDFDNCGSKYCIFTYNAWDYDYYDEPLLSLFISIYKQLNNENAIFIKNEETRKKVRALFETIKDSFLEGLKPIPFIGNIINFKQNYDEKLEGYDNKIRKYDYHFDINQIMDAVLKGFNKLTKDKTVVLFIDELDRCLPEYAIKVLERIHHISKNVQNFQIVYSIDKNQIDNTVRNIFGSDINTNDYLRKFFSFGFHLSSGFINEMFMKKYENLFSYFDFIFTDNFDKEKAFCLILQDINMRTRENIISKIDLINSMLNNKQEKLDISILYAELFLAYCFEKDINVYNCKIHYENNSLYFSIENDNANLTKSAAISKYFDGLSQCHNVKHELSKFGGFCCATVEYVVYNLLNNFINIELPEYSVGWETDFYTIGLGILNDFMKLYKSIEM